MWKDKVKVIVDYIVKHSKIVFPVLVVVAVAVTVSLALSIKSADKLEQRNLETETVAEVAMEDSAAGGELEIVPMTVNENQEITTLITSFYNARALGDTDTLNSVCDEISDENMFKYLEFSKYIESYPMIEIYTKPGLEEGSVIAFVYYKVTFSAYEEQYPGLAAHILCTNEQGEYYIRETEISDEFDEYLGRVVSQDDVKELDNRVTAEYNELMSAKPELLEYMDAMKEQVEVAVGVALAQKYAAETPQEENGASSEAENAEGAQAAEGGAAAPTETPAEPVVQYATATTTVNVRSSDSEQADKVGQVPGGEKLQILEQKVNGWTKVLFGGKEGYIKSEYLELVESAEGAEQIGTITATTKINVRALASKDADILGALYEGDQAALLANENGWCKINYNGQVGYVKADYVELN